MNTLLRRMLVVLAFLCLTPKSAHAFIVKVLYNHLGCPASISRTDVVRAINQSLREWEQHSNGQIIARYDGETTNTSGPSDTIVIVWQSLASGTCATTCRRTMSVAACTNRPPGQIALNLAMVGSSMGAPTNLNPRWSPALGTFRCRDLQSVLIHELAHSFLATEYHPADSVLSYAIPEVSNRHLWTNDINSIPASCFPSTCYPAHALQVRFQTISPPTRTITSTSDLPTTLLPRTPIAIATGSGQGNHNYAMVWGGTNPSGTPGIVLARGDASGWDMQFLARGTSWPTSGRDTVRRPCVAVSTNGQHYYIVWTDPFNMGEALLDPISGSSFAWAMESHDFGNTFSDPEQLPGLFFGDASCSLDPDLNRVVVAMQGTDEGIWISARPAAFSGPGHWFDPVRVTAFGGTGAAPATRDMPHVIFNFFAPGAFGRLMWFEDTTLTHKMGLIGWDVGTQSYQLKVTAPVERVTPSALAFDTNELFRGDPVMSLEGNDEVFYGTMGINTTLNAFRQWTISAMNPAASNFSIWTFGGGVPIAWVTGAASNHNFFEVGTANLMILNPN